MGGGRFLEFVRDEVKRRVVSLHIYREGIVTEFKTPSFYRDLFSEYLATFILMTVQTAVPCTWGNEHLGTIVQMALGMGFIVGAVAWTLGDFGGAHMNPAVTFAMIISLRTTVTRGLMYMLIQCASSVSAVAFISSIYPPNHWNNLAITVLHPEMRPWQGVLVEAWLTFILVLTVLGATNHVRKQNTYMSTLFITMAVFTGVSCGTPSTGGSMNPARSFGPAVMMDFWEHHWIYWVGPFTGSALATLVYYILLDMVDDPGRDDNKKKVDSPPVTPTERVYSIGEDIEAFRKKTSVRFACDDDDDVDDDAVKQESPEEIDEEELKRINAIRARGRRKTLAEIKFIKQGGGIVY